jgi:low affinity Fe/Cu permease
MPLGLAMPRQFSGLLLISKRPFPGKGSFNSRSRNRNAELGAESTTCIRAWFTDKATGRTHLNGNRGSQLDWHKGALMGAGNTVLKTAGRTADSSNVILSSSDRFTKFSVRASHCFGSRWAFVTAIGVILAWGITGPVFHYSDTWQLFINTGTTIVTFLMVFLIQNTQNRDARAIHLKLNELIHAVDKAKNRMIDVENLSDTELENLAKTYEKIRIGAQDRQTKQSL